MAKKDTATIAAILGAVLLGGLAMASGSSLSPAQLNDIILGRIFYIIAIFESSVDFGIWRVKRDSRLKFGWEVSYGVLQSRAEIGMHSIVSRYLELIDDSRKNSYTPAFVIGVYHAEGLFLQMQSSAPAFQRFVQSLDVPVTNINNGQQMTLKQALTKAGREDPDMRIAQIEYFWKDYLQPAFKFCDRHGLKYPVSRLIVSGATIINGYTGMRRKIEPYLRGGNELQEMNAAVSGLNAYYASRRNVLGDVTYRTKAYAQILASDPNMTGPIQIRGRTVPQNVTLSSLASGATPSRGSLPSAVSMDTGTPNDLAYTSWIYDGDQGGDLGLVDNDMGMGYPDMDMGGMDAGYGFDDMGGDPGYPLLPRHRYPVWYRGPGFYTDEYGRVYRML